MTITHILEQVKALSPDEQQQLAQALNEMIQPRRGSTLIDIMNQLHDLDNPLSPEEIEAELREYKQQKLA